MAVEITDSNYESIINNPEGKPVLIDFWAAWCGPCLAIAPLIEEIAKEYDGKAIVGKLDVDNNPRVSMDLGIRNIPTMLFFKNGQVVDKQVGGVAKGVITKKLEAQIG